MDPPDEGPTDSVDPQPDACVELSALEDETGTDDLQIEFACGQVSAAHEEYSAFLGGGQRCQPSTELNTFALRLTGKAAGRYSAVVRCGYVRYDNGTFVGERVQVEGRDGAWCHEPALHRLKPVDRMLLTDVSFALEASSAAPARNLAVWFETRSGSTAPVPAEESLCAYVAFRTPSVSACAMAAPASYCTCPCDPRWEDFFTAATLSLAKR